MTVDKHSESPRQDATYRYCPYDATNLQMHPDREGVARRTCPQCGFVDYQNPRPCVAVLVEHEGRVLLVRRAVEPQQGSWDIPGGFLEPGESAEAAAVRELQEETGLRVEASELTYRMSVPDVYELPITGSSSTRHVATLNLCYSVLPRDWTALEARSDASEVRLFPPEELPALAFAHQNTLLNAWRRHWRKRPAEQP